MKREHHNDEFVLSLAFVTNAADRLATTGEVARIASGLGGSLTTNDVCAIVTNEVVGGWMYESDCPGLDLTKLEMRWNPYGEDMPGWCLFYKGEHISGAPKGKITDTVFVVQNDWMYGPTYKCTATRGPSRNALGLAMAKDVEKKFAEATNAILSIVTNEVVVVSEWSAWSYTYLNFIEPNYDPYIDVQSLEWVESGDVEDCAFPCWRGVFTGKGWNGGYFTSVAYSGYELGRGGRDSEEVILYTGAMCDEGFKARRVKIEERANALGFAMAKDLEKLPDHETVTNVARSVVNSVWDASLGVAWEARMHNGHLYYIVVTNRPPEGR